MHRDYDYCGDCGTKFELPGECPECVCAHCGDYALSNERDRLFIANEMGEPICDECANLAQ